MLYPVFLDVDLGTMGLSPKAVSAFLEEYGEMRDDGCYNKKTGRKIREDNCFINIGIFRYRTETIEDLIKISDFLDCEVIKVINQDNPNKATLFQILEAKIFSMPIRNSDKDKVIASFE